MKAFLKNYRQSPRKVRLVAGLIKGKRVADAFTHLKSLPKRASGPMEKLLASAVANAKQSGIAEENLIVSNVTVNKGVVMMRSMPRARGSASRINKRMSHIMLTLSENTSTKAKKEKVIKEKKAEVKDEKPKAKKVASKKVTKKEDK